MRVAITEAVVAAELLRENRTKVLDLWDVTVRGLVLRILPSGRASWSVRAWTADGKRTSIKIGEHPALKTTAARRQALIHLGAVQQGRDPVGDRRAARAAQRAKATGITVQKALTDWQAARRSAWSRSYISRLESALRVHVPKRLRGQPLAEVRRETWTGMLSAVAQEKSGSGAFLYTVISSFLGYAEVLGWIEHHPLPRRGRSIIAPHVPARTRVLDDVEWLAVWRAAEQEPPKLRVFIRLLILTACRVSEVADIRINEIVANGSIWVIPGERVKNSREHIVPFEGLAQAELGLIWPEDTGRFGAAWMLLGKSPANGFVGNAKLLRRLFQTSGTSNWTWHDLRRTARTGMTYLGVSEAAAEAALNHVTGKGQLVQVYDRSGPAASGIGALRVWQAYVADVVEGRRPPGDAEAVYRDSLPEELRYRSQPRVEMGSKAKPGKPAKTADSGISIDTLNTNVLVDETHDL